VLHFFRIYVHGYFADGFARPVVPFVSVSGYRALVQRFWYDQFGAAHNIVLVSVCHNYNSNIMILEL
jgi:hypothetical protein